MNYKHLLKISAKHTNDLAIDPHYIIKHMHPCECFHLNNNHIKMKNAINSIMKMLNELIDLYDDGTLLETEFQEITSDIINMLDLENERIINSVECKIRTYVLNDYYTYDSKTELIDTLLLVS